MDDIKRIVTALESIADELATLNNTRGDFGNTIADSVECIALALVAADKAKAKPEDDFLQDYREVI